MNSVKEYNKFQLKFSLSYLFSFYLAVTNVGNCTSYSRGDKMEINCTTIEKDLASYWKRGDGKMPPAMKRMCNPPGMMHSNSTVAYGCQFLFLLWLICCHHTYEQSKERVKEVSFTCLYSIINSIVTHCLVKFSCHQI